MSNSETDHLLENPNKAQSVGVRILRGLVLSLIMIFMVGTCFGFPAIQPILVENSLYADACVSVENKKDCIDNAIFVAAATSFGILYCSCFLVGLYLDFVGIRVACLTGSIFWVFFTYLCAVDLQRGCVFFVGLVGGTISVLPIFFGMDKLTTGISPEKLPSLMNCILTGFWDLGTLTYFLLSLVISYLGPLVPIWSTFLTYSLVIGVPTIIFFLLSYPPCLVIEESIPLRVQFENLKSILKFRIYWAFVANNVIWVSYASFFFPLIVNHMKWHGADNDSSSLYLVIWSVLLPGVGFVVSTVAGFGINYKNKYTLVVAAAFQCLLTLLTALTSVLPHTPLWVQIITFVQIIMWRMSAASLFNAMLPVLFQDFQHGLGKAFGLNWSICGIFSSALVQLMTKAVLDNPDLFMVVHIVFCGLGLICALVLLRLFLIDVDETGRAKIATPK